MPKHARVLLSPEQRGERAALIAAGSAPTQKLIKLELHYTPKHASGSDIVEIELSALARQRNIASRRPKPAYIAYPKRPQWNCSRSSLKP